MSAMVGLGVALEVNGANTVASNLAKIQVISTIGIDQGLQVILDHLYNESQLIVPVDKGDLKKSGFTKVTPAGILFGNSTGEVGYTESYAVYVHEDRTKHHDPPTQAKFLEDPLLKYISGGKMTKDFQDELQRVWLLHGGGSP